MHPAQFLSPDPTAHIEPAAFVAHVLAYRGTDVSNVGVRPTVILSFIPELERRLLRVLGSPPPQPHPVQRQTVYNPAERPFSVLASPMGAPMAVMLLEQLIALGARRFLYLGFCGAVDTVYRIGDCCIPTTAIREEGTSYHYLPHDVIPATAAPLNAVLWEHAERQRLVVRQGPVWTTDAPYRETAAKIRHFQSTGVHVVDMEMAALCTVAAYRGCALTALLLVSDECYHPTWRPGFGAAGLRQACQSAVNACVAAATHIATLP